MNKRDSLFSSPLATPEDRFALVCSVIFFLLALAQFALSIAVVARSSGHRSATVVLMVGIFVLLLARSMDIVYFAELYADISNGTWFGILAGDAVVGYYTDTLLLISGFYVIYDRSNAHYIANPQTAPRRSTLLKVMEWIFFVMMFIFASVGVVFVAVVETVYYTFDDISADQYTTFIHAAYGVRDVYTFFYLVVIIDFVVSAFLLKSRIARTSSIDSPSRKVLLVLAPLYVVHGLYWLGTTIYFGNLFPRPEPNGVGLGLEVFSTIEGCLLPFLIASVLLWLGWSSKDWSTFGAKRPSDFQQPQFYVPQQYQPQYPGPYQQYPPQQPQQFAPYGQKFQPQTQQFQPQAGVAQPVHQTPVPQGVQSGQQSALPANHYDSPQQVQATQIGSDYAP